jgi:RHH-type proline utilization regulon transcriptional repressor/proline dehydrogenase/delta 1-pyrroline-5-carboxylate dehydrogenase
MLHGSKFEKDKIMDGKWNNIEEYYRYDETKCVENILVKAAYPADLLSAIQNRARELVIKVREKRLASSGLDAFMFQYDLSSEEGIALMCLAEALLRIPDQDTVDKLIRDKLSEGNWRSHLGRSHSFFVNAATWALMLTGKVVGTSRNTEQQGQTLTRVLRKLASKGGEPIVRQAVGSAMKILGRQFVMGRTIKRALKRAKKREAKGYRFSYDMLGEAAYTQQDADKYFEAYQNAIEAVGNDSAGKGAIKGPGVSVKLSALHPRFSIAKKERLERELYPKLEALVLQAKQADINLTVDAEEAHTLTITLFLIEKIIQSGVLGEWQGFGLAVQAYQKRAPYVLEWLFETLRRHHAKMMVRLVKGAYWDTEIKLSQVQGLCGYPVYTRKVSTDVNYIACVKSMLDATDVIYPQFATHNAMTLATVCELAEFYGVKDFEFQCLHGMGAPLYDEIVGEGSGRYACRVYAPVGTQEELLAYLVRRLLENGANTSFVNRIADEKLPIEDMLIDPIQKLKSIEPKPNPHIPLPIDLYSPYRENSRGLDMSDPKVYEPAIANIKAFSEKAMVVPSLLGEGKKVKRYSPVNRDHLVGEVAEATSHEAVETLHRSEMAYASWKQVPADTRATYLERTADLLEKHQDELMSLLVYEGGKTLDDAISEVREAVDFCRYYAMEARKLFGSPLPLPGPTGEKNQLSLHSIGTIACISPWNFPLAIFLGQVTASLAAGNCVIAKPASQTVCIGARAVELLHEAGFPRDVVQLLAGKGSVVGDSLVKDHRVQGIVFTGSTETAQHINQQLAARKGPITRLIAETGGQNAMIVDSSALPEQVTQDVLTSAFRSAGQRCSALRVLFLQEDIADKILKMIVGAMAELKIGDPSELSTDIGPVIDEASKLQLDEYVEKMKRVANHLYEIPLSQACANGSYMSAHIIEIPNLSMLTREVFGPILHVIRFPGGKLDEVITQINNTGYGLTLGIHSRINETIEKIVESVHVGNIYVNRNMIGAVVGVQPFGGEGLSGTGPKAGGPYYLPRLAVERTLTINTTASGGNATLMSLEE